MIEDPISEDAIELCNREEYYGDETMGSCLAPGGESCFVWISPDEVMEAAWDTEFLIPFRMAVLNRSDSLGALNETSLVWRDVVMILGEGVVIAPVCGGAIASGVSGAIPVAVTLGGLCVLDGFAMWNSMDKITHEAEGFVDALNGFYIHQIDAPRNFCRGGKIRCRVQIKRKRVSERWRYLF